jgi:hypothetical protein
MDAHKVEPFIFVSSWLEELDAAFPEISKHTLVPNVAHAVESEFGSPFL